MKRILTYQIEENTTIEKFLKAKSNRTNLSGSIYVLPLGKNFQGKNQSSQSIRIHSYYTTWKIFRPKAKEINPD